MRNPLKNARVVAKNYDSREYVRREHRRGDPQFVMSRSELLDFAKCPSKWIRGGGRGDESTDSTEWGSLIDCVLLEPERFDDRFAVYPETYPAKESAKKDAPIIEKDWNNNATFCKEWKAERAGKIFFAKADMELCATAIARLKEDETISRILDDSDFQVYITAEYHDRATGLVIPVKALLDIVPRNGGAIYDLKTARDASPKRWADVVNSCGYHVQAALFLDAYNSTTRSDANVPERNLFRHIVQENEAPFEIAKHELSTEFIDTGREIYVEALKLYAHCLKANHWPGYESREMFSGWNLISPKAYMATAPNPDPEWMEENTEQKEAA